MLLGCYLLSIRRRQPQSPHLFPYTTLFRSLAQFAHDRTCRVAAAEIPAQQHVVEDLVLSASGGEQARGIDRKSTRLNSSHPSNSYAVFCLTKNWTIHLFNAIQRRLITPSVV